MILNLHNQANKAVSHTVCPICEDGNLTDHTDLNHFVRNGVFVQTVYHFSVCDGCGSEQVNAQQMDKNNELGNRDYQEAILNLQGGS